MKVETAGPSILVRSAGFVAEQSVRSELSVEERKKAVTFGESIDLDRLLGDDS